MEPFNINSLLLISKYPFTNLDVALLPPDEEYLSPLFSTNFTLPLISFKLGLGLAISTSPPIIKFIDTISFLLLSSEKLPIVSLLANLNLRAFSPSNDDVST